MGETLLCVCVCAHCLCVFFKRSRQRLSIQATKSCQLLSSLTRRGTKMSIISCFTFGAKQQCCPEKDERLADSLCQRSLWRRINEMQHIQWPADVLHAPSVKLHLSQPEEEGVVHGETPSSPSKIKTFTIKPVALYFVSFFTQSFRQHYQTTLMQLICICACCAHLCFLLAVPSRCSSSVLVLAPAVAMPPQKANLKCCALSLKLKYF